MTKSIAWLLVVVAVVQPQLDAGGGGAGGMRVFTDVPVTTGNYGVTIGAGGAGDPYPS